MTEPSVDGTGFGWSRVETERRQLESGLAMTPAERLEWLEQMLDELLPVLGRARRPHPTAD